MASKMTKDIIQQRFSGDNQPAMAESTFSTNEPIPMSKKLLLYLSNGSNETLVATGILLCLLIYILLGRVGLIFVGMLVGVILQASWGEDRPLLNKFCSNGQKLRQRRTNRDLISEILDWRVEASSSEVNIYKEPAVKSSNSHPVCLQSLPRTTSALENFKDAIIRDYVL